MLYVRRGRDKTLGGYVFFLFSQALVVGWARLRHCRIANILTLRVSFPGEEEIRIL